MFNDFGTVQATVTDVVADTPYGEAGSGAGAPDPAATGIYI